MSIGIIGYGFVGKAVGFLHGNKDILIIDPLLVSSSNYTDISKCDGVYVCVPSPSRVDGTCDTSILETVLDQLKDVGYTTKPIISKVTAPPEVYKKLIALYPNLVYCPEFLVANSASTDIIRRKEVIIGGNQEFLLSATKVIKSSGIVFEYYYTDIVTASLVKYMANTFLAAKVTLMNMYYEVAMAHDINYNELTTLLQLDKRMGNSHFNVPGFDGRFGWGGMCFPKDVSAFIKSVEALGVESIDVLKKINDQNTADRKKTLM